MQNPFMNIEELKNLITINGSCLDVGDEDYIYPPYPCFVYYDRTDKDDIDNFLKGYIVVDSKEATSHRGISQSYYELGGVSKENLKVMIKEVKDESIQIYLHDIFHNRIWSCIDDNISINLDRLDDFKLEIQNNKSIDLNTRLLVESLSIDEFIGVL